MSDLTNGNSAQSLDRNEIDVRRPWVLFGAGIWTGWGTGLERGRLQGLSNDGHNFQRYGDTGLALAFKLSGKSPVVVINDDSQAQPPYDPESLRLLESYDKYKDYRYNDESDNADAAAPAGSLTESSSSLDRALAFSNKTIWRLKNGNTLHGRLVRVNKERKTFVMHINRGRIVSLALDRFHESEQKMLSKQLD